jgi:hypothetical protein
MRVERHVGMVRGLLRREKLRKASRPRRKRARKQEESEVDFASTVFEAS